MTRRIVLAVLVSTAAWLLVAPLAGAETYPPTPIVAPGPTQVVVSPTPVVVVSPAVPRQALGRTGTSDTLPLAALATASVLLGATLVGVAHRRRRNAAA